MKEHITRRQIHTPLLVDMYLETKKKPKKNLKKRQKSVLGHFLVKITKKKR